MPPVAKPTRDEAWELVCEWVSSESLRKHLLGVEAGMVAYADKLGGDRELWAVAGLVHDLDYERHPDLSDQANGHPRTALRLFEELDWPQELIDAVAGHATFLGVPRETEMAKALFAVDELSGFIAACALVRGLEAEVGEEEAEDAVVRGRGQPRRGLPGRRGVGRRFRRARRVRDRGHAGARR
jgi:putative nucleotidyltransferase with HDIG domain